MKNRIALNLNTSVVLTLIIALGILPITSRAQDRLKTMPGYDRYEKMSKEIPGSVKGGSLNVKWKDGGKSFDYYKDGKTYHYDIVTRATTEAGPAPADAEAGRGAGRRRGGPERGRQFGSATSPDGKLKAIYRDRNLWLGDATSTNGVGDIAITTDGNEKARTKYGSGSWVYGEELDQTTAMWWSPSSKKIAFYRFDESPVPDYYLELDQTKLQSKMDIEAYPKAGVNNPIADILIYDVDTKKTVKLDVRD